MHSRTTDGPTNGASPGWFRRSLGVFRYSRRAVELVWATSRGLTVALAALTLIAGLLPPAIAWTGSLIIDAVVAAIDSGAAAERAQALLGNL